MQRITYVSVQINLTVTSAMNLLNTSGMAVPGYTMGMDKTGAEYVVVVVKGTFILPKQGEAPKLADEQVPLVDADLFTGEPGRSCDAGGVRLCTGEAILRRAAEWCGRMRRAGDRWERAVVWD